MLQQPEPQHRQQQQAHACPPAPTTKALCGLFVPWPRWEEGQVQICSLFAEAPEATTCFMAL